MKEINPNIVENLSRLSKIIKSENSYIKNEVKNIYNRIATLSLGKIEIDIHEFQKLELSLKQNLILYAINQIAGSTRNIEKINIDDIIKMSERNVGKKYMLINKNLKVLIENKKIIFIALT